jgi:hypothetical protein
MSECEPLPTRLDAAESAEVAGPCAKAGAFLAAIGELYEEVDRRVAAGGARCLGGGGCCKFDLAGHRLYLSTGELVFLAHDAPPAARAAPGRCPYQSGGRCLARARRPLGCRVYFCRAGRRRTETENAPDAAQDILYEEFHGRIKALHERFGVPYQYVELTAAMENRKEGHRAWGV